MFTCPWSFCVCYNVQCACEYVPSHVAHGCYGADNLLYKVVFLLTVCGLSRLTQFYCTNFVEDNLFSQICNFFLHLSSLNKIMSSYLEYVNHR